jgi:hypothetical protein
MGQPDKGDTTIGAEVPVEPAAGEGVSVAFGRAVAPPTPPESCAAGEVLGPVSGAEAEGSGLAGSLVPVVVALADLVAGGEYGLAVFRVAGTSCGNANANPIAATNRMARPAGAKRRNSKPEAKSPTRLATRHSLGSLASADAGSVVWRQLAASSRSAMR